LGAITDATSYNVRLKLNSVTEVSAIGNENPPYLFYYNELYTMPSRLSFDQDSWGYYNGPKNNTDLVPPYTSVSSLGLPRLWPGANRETDDKYISLGVLTKIVYPTGGSTSFEYE